uniref:Uncharacterized protein n=1 Tax=Anopheles melas TaxID=34690 RepID=A0A182U1V6_9DIPT
MTMKLFRRGSPRCIGLLSAFVTILLCLYYISMGQPSPAGSGPSAPTGMDGKDASGGPMAAGLAHQKRKVIVSPGTNVFETILLAKCAGRTSSQHHTQIAFFFLINYSPLGLGSK